METETTNLVALFILILAIGMVFELVKEWWKDRTEMLEMDTPIHRKHESVEVLNIVNVDECKIAEVTYSDLMRAAKKIYNDLTVRSPEMVKVNNKRVKLFNEQCRRLGLVGVSRTIDLDVWSPVER